MFRTPDAPTLRLTSVFPSVELLPSVWVQVLQKDLSASLNMAGSVRGPAALILQRKEGERSSTAHWYGLNMSQDSTVPEVLGPSLVCCLSRSLLRRIWLWGAGRSSTTAGRPQLLQSFYNLKTSPVAFLMCVHVCVHVLSNETNIRCQRCQRHLLAVRVLWSFI